MSLAKDYSNLWAKQTSKAYAGVYPLSGVDTVDPLNQTDALIQVGNYGSYKDATFQPIGNIFDDFGVPRSAIQFGVAGGSYNFASDKLKQTCFTIGATYQEVPSVPSDAAQAALEYTSTSHDQFKVTISDDGMSKAWLDIEVLNNLMSQIQQRSGFDKWRFIYMVGYARSFVLFGAEAKKATLMLQGSGQVLSDYGEGTLSGSLSITKSNDMDFQFARYKSETYFPVYMSLGSFSTKSGHLFQVDQNDPQ